MISNQILQNTIDGLHQISKIEFAVMDSEGGVLATTISDAKQYKEAAVSFAMSEAESQVVPGCQFFKVYDEQQLEFVVLAIGVDEEETQMVGKIATFQIQELMVAYKERFDRDNFIKNLLLDNLLLVDIYNRAKKLHIDVEARRVVMIVETGSKKDGDEIDRIRSVFSGKTRDFVTAVDENNIIVVKELAENETLADVHKIASVIVDTFKDRSNEIRISYGTVVKEIKEVSRSYKEAGLALDVGKIFIEERNIIAYSELGIAKTCTCTPYLVGNVPRFRDHVSWSESSAVAYVNSVIGARSNREGGPAALAAAIVGKELILEHWAILSVKL